MNTHYRDTRKIDPTKGAVLGDNTPNDADRAEIGPTLLAYGEWEAAGLELPDLQEMRRFRWKRLTRHVVDRGLAGVLMFDPLNIRYATDSTNMQLWNAHNPFRAVLLCADGYMVIWDYKLAPFLTAYNPLVREVRGGASMFYFTAGDGAEDIATAFARDVAGVLAEHAPGETRLAVDKIMLVGARALEAAGFELTDGEEVTEKARSIKGSDEIRAMRCSIHACEAAMYEMERVSRAEIPKGTMSEDDIWAILHAENIRRGGEWIETRLLASGPRTNPWFQECGARYPQMNEILAFDTDLVGPYGICTDISRTWWIGDRAPRADMVEAMKHGHEHIMRNMELLRPGLHFAELTEQSHRLHDKYLKRKYSCIMHGVGLCDEWPHIDYPDCVRPKDFDYVFEPGMVVCSEALIAEDGGDFSIKLEDQVLITEDGFECLSTYPFDPWLMGERTA
ncbi:MAG: dimethylsulfonioproprionate lyase DddP [Pseudomonadota bacterium]